MTLPDQTYDIVFVGERPIVMKWNPEGKTGLSDVSDVSDATSIDPLKKSDMPKPKTGTSFEGGDQKSTSDIFLREVFAK